MNYQYRYYPRIPLSNSPAFQTLSFALFICLITTKNINFYLSITSLLRHINKTCRVDLEIKSKVFAYFIQPLDNLLASLAKYIRNLILFYRLYKLLISCNISYLLFLVLLIFVFLLLLLFIFFYYLLVSKLLDNFYNRSDNHPDRQLKSLTKRCSASQQLQYIYL